MKKTFLKKVSALCIVAALAVGMTACGGSSDATTAASGSDPVATEAPAGTETPATEATAPASGTGDKYVNTGKDFTIKTSDLPADYKLIAHDKFTEGFKAIVDGTATSYADIAAAFGDDGIRMDGIVYEGYSYYAWYSDKDATPDCKTNVLVTFKIEGDNLVYYAYSSVGIDAQDVK